jgi:two-component system NtrC family sensor kinase
MDAQSKVFRAHILVAEDDLAVALMLAESLRGAGHDPAIVATGAEAIEYIRKGTVDLVLLDMVLTDTGAIPVARQMKEHFGSDNFVPIIILSAMSDEENKVNGLVYADEYITKPYTEAELLARVKAMLRIRMLQLELLQSRDRYRFLYQNIPEMCVSIDEQNRIFDCNIAFSQALAKEEDTLRGTSIFDAFESGDRKLLGAYLSTLRERRSQSKQHIFRMLPSEHFSRPRRVSLRGAYTGGPSAVLVMLDITQTLLYEEEQKTARRQLYRAAQIVSIGTLASGVAHELNNPLAAVLGFSDALLHRFENNEPIDPGELEQYLGIIKTESLRCRDIIDNLLKFSRDREPQIRDISLLDCIQSASSLLANRAAKKRIQIKNTIREDIFIRADAQRMGQVFINVLANAIDFSPQDASVTIDLKSVLTEKGYAVVHISDKGPGIAPDVLPRIFDPFFTTKEVGQGTGIGLSICHKAMEECEGVIDVISGKGNGTVVVLEIPLGQQLT